MRAVSLFSGCGGFCEGVRLGGFDVHAAVELDRYAVETYRHNFPEVPLFHGDVCDFLNDGSVGWRRERPRFLHVKQTPTDLVFGGPPCQGFSQIGPRAVDDPRNTLYQEFVRVLAVLQPKVFLMENVPNMLALAGGRFKDEVLAALSNVGYSNAGVALVYASDYGVAQLRRRAIFFGVSDKYDLGMDARDFLVKSLEAERVPTPSVGKVLQDLPEGVSEDDGPLPYPSGRRVTKPGREYRLDRDGNWYSSELKLAALGGLSVQLYNHHTKSMMDRRRELIQGLKAGANGRTLSPGVWSGARAEKWRRLDPEKPSHTILAQMHRDMSEWVHPWLHRWITVREAARLQSFHDGFVFKSSEWQMLKQVGNAVPPLMARALAVVAAAAISRLTSGREELNRNGRRRTLRDGRPGAR
ncbi:DNA cytosine methyltransferase [Amycolatopsis rubida]|uniref:DNA cytosine methyltransferase n=1 Tax=Amycolatopsis rubida TaxID=112413 RepID=UPI000B878ABD|nr:DNA cytosine methyltransferase [Amycolatopsis rubida]